MDNALVPGSVREAQLERLMALYGDSLLRMCYVYLRDAALAQDAVQDTFVKAYKNLDSFAFSGEQSEKAWLMRIAVNTCKDVRRSAWFRFVDRRVTPDMLRMPADEVSFQDRSLAVAIMHLPEKCKMVILLHYYQGLKVQEIGKLLNISASAVYARLKRAESILRGKLEGWDQDA